MKKLDFNGKRNICGNQIRCLRQKKRMSQAQMAARLQIRGVNLEQDGVSRVESGERLVTDYELRAFARVLGVSVEELFEPEEDDTLSE